MSESASSSNDNNNENNLNNIRTSNNVRTINENINNQNSILVNFFSLYIDPLKKKIESLKVENDKLNDRLKSHNNSNMCAICLENQSEYIYIPCGHLCICSNCSDKCQTLNILYCPVCRGTGDKYKVYKI